MSAFTGTARLVRLALRRDRMKLSVWVGGITLVALAMASVMISEYPTAAERLQAASLIAHNPALLIIRGAAPATNAGGLALSEGSVIWGVLAALMSIFAMVRHTRQNEEAGRSELIGSAPVGRLAGLTAALMASVGASIALAGLISLALIMKGLPLDGSLAAGVGIGTIGITFAAISAVVVQLSESARTTSSLAMIVLGVTYLLRGAGDAFGNIRPDNATITSAWPSWLSPIGWAQQMRPFGENKWWVLILPLGLFAVATIAAYALSSKRDVGAGMLPSRPGPSVAAPSLLSTLGLAWRLQRGVLIAWLLAMAVFGAAFGSLGKQVTELQNSQVAQLFAKLGGESTDFSSVFFAAILAILGGIATGYIIQALLVTENEEADGRLEPILATAVPRRRWLMSHIICAMLGITSVFLTIGLTMGVAYGLVAGELSKQVVTLVASALVIIPASLVVAGAVIAAIGFAARWAKAIAWAVFAAALVFGPFGEFFNLPDSVRDFSPFSHTPALPGAELALTPVLALLAIAAALSILGIISFRRRDISV